MDFSFKTLGKAEFIKIRPNHFKIEALFGSLYYQNEEYKIYDAHFKYPSEHRVRDYGNASLMGRDMLLKCRPLQSVWAEPSSFWWCYSRGMTTCRWRRLVTTGLAIAS